jgi:hypothetical protein
MSKRGGLAIETRRRAIVYITLSFLTAGCVADPFGERAIVYNQEAAKQKDQIILTNIIRASLGSPLQFTDLTTVSGTASAGVTLAGTITSPTSTFSPTVTLSGGPTFSVANLSTKEFYSGILAPLSMQLIAYYLLQGYSPQILLPLVIAAIDYGPKGHGYRILNTAENFNIFYTALNELIALGLTVEPVSDTTSESPPLSYRDAKEPKLLASLASGAAAGNQTLDLKRYEVNPKDPTTKDPNLSDSESRRLKSEGQTEYYRLQKSGKKYRFCMDPSIIAAALVNHPPGTLPIKIHLLKDSAEVYIGESSLCSTNKNEHKGEQAQDTSVKGLENLTFQPRSVEGIIYFLGDTVRLNMPPAVFNEPTGGGMTTLFAVAQSMPQGSNILARVNTGTFYVKVDASGQDKSSRVIQLLAELIALNNSAKDLPAPNVITVISP